MNRYMKKMALGLAALLILAVPASSMADDSIVEIRREEVGQMALDYSPTVKGLVQDRIDLSVNYRSVKDGLAGLEMLYDQLGNYEDLYNFYNSMSANYKIWLAASAAVVSDPSDADLAVKLAELTDGVYVADPDNPPDGTIPDPADAGDGNDLTVDEEIALKAEVDSGVMMSVEAYLGYVALQTQFQTAGITNPNLSKEEEYETFVYPLNIAPLGLQNGIAQLGVAIDQAGTGIASGAESIYDAVLMLEGFLSLQKLSYEMAQDSLLTAEKKFELGQVSESAYKQAVNDEKIALLNYQTMERDVENLKMQLNVMLGQPVETPLALSQTVGETYTLEALQFYITRAQNQRAEIQTNAIDTTSANTEASYVEEYLGSRTIEYLRLDNQLTDLSLDKQYTLEEISAEVRKAYMAVKDAEENIEVKRLAMEDAQRQQAEMALNVSLGFVTESMAKGIDVLVVNATNDYYKAYRDYLAAYEALELTSTIGQASMGGF